MVHDLWRNQRRPQGGGAWVEWWGRIQSAEIRLMYYDIAVCNSCTKTPHLQSISLENVGDVGRGREFNQEQREKGKEKEPLCEDRASCIKNVCAVRPDFSATRGKYAAAASDSDLNVNRLSKELFLGGCLHSACGIGFSWHENC